MLQPLPFSPPVCLSLFPLLPIANLLIDDSAYSSFQGLTPNFRTSDCDRLGFAAAIYPCTGFIPAMLAMQGSYRSLKDDGSDLEHCQGRNIKDFFRQCGLDEAFAFDKRIEEFSKEAKHKSQQAES